MIRNAVNTILHAKHYMGHELALVSPTVAIKNQCEVKVNEHNKVVFSVEKDSQPIDLALSEVVTQQLKFLTSNLFRKRFFQL
jgi:hypothetical protein